MYLSYVSKGFLLNIQADVNSYGRGLNFGLRFHLDHFCKDLIKMISQTKI